MRINKICPVLEPKINKLVELKRSLIFTQIIGDYSTYKIVHQEYADFGVKNFELLKSVNFPDVNVPLFSREGLNMMKIMVKEMFREKTPEEKLLTKLFREERLRTRYNITP